MTEMLRKIKSGEQVKGFAEDFYNDLRSAWNAGLIQYFRGDGWELTDKGRDYSESVQ